MNSVARRVIWSVGHSNRYIRDFIDMLHSLGVQVLVDVRSMPASRYCPQFNKNELSASLHTGEIAYMHMLQLGGHVPGGFSAYMSTAEFSKAIAQLEDIASAGRAAYMCAEADWKHCHRSLISAHLDNKGWEVRHIKGINQFELHSPLLQQSKLFF